MKLWLLVTSWTFRFNKCPVVPLQIGQGSGGPKEGIQYSNEAFERDDDGGSVGSGGNFEGSEWDSPSKKAIQISSGPLYNSKLPDDASDTSSNSADKEVKPILTKERRTEDGYKSVWFKEDIDPNAKEEVVIIPDSRDEDSEGEEPSSSGREDEDDNLKTKVFFTETDLDSGLGVKIEDLAGDSETDQDLNVDLWKMRTEQQPQNQRWGLTRNQRTKNQDIPETKDQSRPETKESKIRTDQEPKTLKLLFYFVLFLCSVKA